MASPVWIIDGSLVARTILEITLRRLGIASSSYSEGNEALRDLWEEPDAAPGLMLIEGQLPDMDGYEVIMQVRRLLSRGQTAIVVLSNRNSTLDRFKGRLAGAGDYLTKPFCDLLEAGNSISVKGRKCQPSAGNDSPLFSRMEYYSA